MKNFKFIIVTLVSLYWFNSNAQSSLILNSNITYQQLSISQKSKYDIYASDSTLKNFKLINIQSLTSLIDSGRVFISLNEYFPCNLISFTINQNEFISDSNYILSGNIENDTNNTCDHGSIDLACNDGEFVGNISISRFSFEIFDLTGGLQLMV